MKNRKPLFLLSVCLLLLVMFFSYTVGIANISFVSAVKVLLSRLPLINIDLSEISRSQYIILYDLRLPRVLIAAASGMSLAVVGAVFQGLFQNRLADPYVLGISSGASLGASVAIALSFRQFFLIFSSVAIFASAGALLTVCVVILIYTFSPKKSSTLLLTGLAAGYFASGFSTMIAALNPDKIKVITMWAMGSFSSSNWDKTTAIVPLALFGLLLLMFFARDLNAISTGEDAAKSFGISVGRTRVLLVIIASILTALSVATSGIIGFVGLIVPNGIRIFSGPDYRRLIPLSAVFGAIFMVLCDTLARTIFAPSEIPVGAITALIGTPMFIWLIVKGRRVAE